jgi:uncharacterized membrane protein YraQ (UPF0718 family)
MTGAAAADDDGSRTGGGRNSDDDERRGDKNSGRRGGGGNNRPSWYVLGAVLVLYAVAFAVDPAGVRASVGQAVGIFLRILPILVLVTLLIAASNYALRPERVSRYAGRDSGARGFAVAAVAGVLSHGPVYVWYTLLADLRAKGMRGGLVAVFLYNRAIKLPLLPLFVYYFGLHFAAVLLGWMVVASVVQGLLVEALQQGRAFPSVDR